MTSSKFSKRIPCLNLLLPSRHRQIVRTIASLRDTAIALLSEHVTQEHRHTTLDKSASVQPIEVDDPFDRVTEGIIRLDQEKKGPRWELRTMKTPLILAKSAVAWLFAAAVGYSSHKKTSDYE